MSAKARRAPVGYSMFGEFAQHPSEVHFRLSGLETGLERRLEQPLRLGFARALAEQIGIAAEILGRRERNCIDPLLHGEEAGGGKLGDPMSERPDEIVERMSRQCAI